MNPPYYTDLGDLEEDARIELIGHRVVDHREIVGFVVEKEEDGSKGDRYIRKLQDRFPQITVFARFNGPFADVETIKVGVLQ